MAKQRNSLCHRTLCAELKLAREAAEMSQRQVSDALKRPHNFSHFVESGNRTLTVCEFIEYINALDGDASVIVGRLQAQSRRK